MNSKLLLALFIVLALMPALTACGKKPSFVDPPTGQEGPFPRTYPQSNGPQGEATPGADD